VVGVGSRRANRDRHVAYEYGVALRAPQFGAASCRSCPSFPAVLRCAWAPVPLQELQAFWQ
jgi:hypothetical protein